MEKNNNQLNRIQARWYNQDGSRRHPWLIFIHSWADLTGIAPPPKFPHVPVKVMADNSPVAFVEDAIVDNLLLVSVIDKDFCQRVGIKVLGSRYRVWVRGISGDSVQLPAANHLFMTGGMTYHVQSVVSPGFREGFGHNFLIPLGMASEVEVIW